MDKTPSISNNYFKDRLDKIKKYYEPINKDDLEIYDNTKRSFINFLSYDDPINLFYNITNGDAKYLQKSFKKRIKDLKDYDIANMEKYKIYTIKNLYNLRNRVIKFFDDYNLMQKDNNSESLLNEIRHIVYSLYPSKEITKKVYNNIIKSIKI